MIIDRLAGLMKRLTCNTLLGDFVAPALEALAQTRRPNAGGTRVLGMDAFITLGVLRHLQAIPTLREQVQSLLHLSPAQWTRPPLARSTWSDALSSIERQAVLEELLPRLVRMARKVLPDRLAAFDAVGGRSVYAMDGSYQGESAHYRRCAPRDGGVDNPKGHALLTFYDVRLGGAVDARTETDSRHEMALLKDYDDHPGAVTRERGALWLVDRAFIDASYWDEKKRRLKVTMITRMKCNLSVESTEVLPVAPAPVNEGVVSDLRITLLSSGEFWRLVTFRSRRGHTVEFLTNDFTLEPGMVAFLYARRWDEEKCFDTWKNDLAQARAWGRSRVAIQNQTLLAIITALCAAMLVHQVLGDDGAVDHKSLDKQARRQTGEPGGRDGTDRPDWTIPLYRHVSKMSRQVLRFFRHGFLLPASDRLYQQQLRPLLMAYL